MKWIFISAISFFILWKFPTVFLILALILGIMWFISAGSNDPLKYTIEEEGKPFKPYERFHKTAYKKDFEDDPDWQAMSKRIREHVQGQEEKNNKDIIAEQEEEIRKLKRELKQSGNL